MNIIDWLHATTIARFQEESLRDLLPYMPQDNLSKTIFSQKYKLARCIKVQPSLFEFPFGKTELSYLESLIKQAYILSHIQRGTNAAQ
jgi:hypothetical protein